MAKSKTNIEIQLQVDKSDIVKEMERIQREAPKIDVRLLARNDDALGFARAWEKSAKHSKELVGNIRQIRNLAHIAMAGVATATAIKQVTPHVTQNPADQIVPKAQDSGPIIHLPFNANKTNDSVLTASVGQSPEYKQHILQRNDSEDVEGEIFAGMVNRAKSTSEKDRTKFQKELLEYLEEEDDWTPTKESLAVLERLKAQGKLPQGGIEYLEAQKDRLGIGQNNQDSTADNDQYDEEYRNKLIEIGNKLVAGLYQNTKAVGQSVSAITKTAPSVITTGVPNTGPQATSAVLPKTSFPVAAGIQATLQATGQAMQTATGGGGKGKPPIKQQQKYNELLKAGIPLLNAMGISGWKSFTAIGTAVAALTGLTLKLISRMKEAEEFAKSIHMIGNELKGLATRINVLGYYTDDMINQFVAAQVEAEKLAWQNRFLTEEDKQLAETFRGLKTGLWAFAGTMVDLVGQIVSDFLPTFESVRDFMVDQVAPATAVVVTAFEVMADGLGTAFNFVHGVLAKFVSALLDMPTYASNITHNLGEILKNSFGHIGLAIQAFMEDYIFLLPDHLTNFFKGFGENLKIFGSNVVKFFSNLAGNIGKFVQGLNWENLKKWWKGEINLAEMFNVKDMENLFSDWDSDSAMYKRDASGKVMLDENGNKIVDTERGFVDTDSKMRENKELRERAYLQGLGLSDEDMKDPQKVSEAWSLLHGTRDLTEGTGQGLAGEFSKAGDRYFANIGETLDKYSDGIEGLYKKNNEKITGLMNKNWMQEAEKDRPTFNMGPWERLQTLLTQNQKASTESLASAYDRINNAVANRNPVVEAIQKQMESQRAFEEETKAMDKESLEYQKKSREHEEKMAGALQGIYDFLHRNNPQLAAVVEG